MVLGEHAVVAHPFKIATRSGKHSAILGSYLQRFVAYCQERERRTRITRGRSNLPMRWSFGFQAEHQHNDGGSVLHSSRHRQVTLFLTVYIKLS